MDPMETAGLSEEALQSLAPQQQEPQTSEAAPPETPQQEQPPQPDPMEQRLSQYEQNLQRLYQNEHQAAQTIYQLKATIEAMRNEKAQPPQPQPSDDPVERMVEERISRRMEEMQQYQHQQMAPLAQQLQQQQAVQEWTQRAQQSQNAARAQYTDYDDVAAAAIPWVQQQQQAAQMGDPNAQAYLQMIYSSPNPAEVLYTLGARIQFDQQRQAAAQQPAQNPQLPQAQAAPQGMPDNVVQMPRGTDITGGAGGGGGDIDLANLTSEQWRGLPEGLRNKILRGE